MSLTDTEIRALYNERIVRPIVGEPRAPAPVDLRGKTSWTLAELLATEFPEPRWVVPSLLPVGLSLLAGRPKLGKSFLALQLAVAVSTGGHFLDAKVDAGPALFVALEDSARRLQQRLRQMGAPSGAPLQFETEWVPLNAEAGGMLDLQNRVSALRPRLVVIDTLARAFSSRVDWNDVAGTTGAMAMLQSMALDQDFALLAVDHHKKGSAFEPDLVDDVLGSTGKAAVADTVWGLYRKRGEHGATLKVTGRDIEDASLAIEFDRDTVCWQLLGDARQVAKDSVQGQLLTALKSLDGKATVTELGEYTGLDRGHVSRELGELVSKGAVIRGKREGKRVPYLLPDAT